MRLVEALLQECVCVRERERERELVNSSSSSEGNQHYYNVKHCSNLSTVNGVEANKRQEDGAVVERAVDLGRTRCSLPLDGSNSLRGEKR